MITQPTVEKNASDSKIPSGKWEKFAMTAGVAYFAYDAILPRITVNYALTPIWAQLTLVVMSTLLFMLLQIWVPRAVIGMEWNVPKSVLGAVFFAAIWTTASFAVHIPHIGSATRGLTLTVSLAFLGSLLSRIVREGKMLLPIALVAMLIDVVGAMTNIGFTHHFTQKGAQMVEHFSAPMPMIGLLHPISYVGPGDALFIAFFFGVIQRRRMNVSGTFWTMFGLLSAAMLVVLTNLGNVAALLPMGIAVIAANVRDFRFDRSEVFAMIYASAIAIAATMGFFIYSHTRFSHDDPHPASHQRIAPSPSQK